MIPAAFLPAAIDACALYRMFIPHLNLENSRFVFRLGPLDINEFQHCKVAVVQRQVSENNRIAMCRLKERGLKVIYDLDDNIWALPASNPGKAAFDKYREGFRMCAAEADVLTVSTQGLASAARTGFNLNKEIFVVPNAIDFNLYKKKDLKREDNAILLGWGGSNTHSEDVRDTFETVADVLDANPQAKMEIVGAPSEDVIEEIYMDNGVKKKRKTTKASRLQKHERTKFRLWVPVGEYPVRFASWGWDIALAPLAENRFNRSKSNIKMLEAAAIGIPCLVSDVQPYNEFCSLGGADLKWLLCSNQAQWKHKLTALINEPERRDFLAKRMREVSDRWFNITSIKENWMHVFRTVLQ